jgi:hypothetical protein
VTSTEEPQGFAAHKQIAYTYIGDLYRENIGNKTTEKEKKNNKIHLPRLDSICYLYVLLPIGNKQLSRSPQRKQLSLSIVTLIRPTACVSVLGRAATVRRSPSSRSARSCRSQRIRATTCLKEIQAEQGAPNKCRGVSATCSLCPTHTMVH